MFPSPLVNFRNHRRQVHLLARDLERIADRLSHVEEAAGDAEAIAAAYLKARGPVEHDGRRYEHEVRDGIDCVRVTVAPVPSPVHAGSMALIDAEVA